MKRGPQSLELDSYVQMLVFQELESVFHFSVRLFFNSYGTTTQGVHRVEECLLRLMEFKKLIQAQMRFRG